MNRKHIPALANTGFTILEILVVVAIIAILVSLALPSYQQYLLRGHRAGAIHSLLAIAGCQERIRASTGYYDTSRCYKEYDDDKYVFSISPADEPRALKYSVMATPQVRSDADNCGSMAIDQAGTRSIGGEEKHLPACWGGR